MKTVQLSRERDIPILNFLWKWKLATTAAIARRFFPPFQAQAAYKRLRILAQAGFIETYADTSGTKFVWRLTEKGYAAIKESLGLLAEEGFHSESIDHDLLCAAFQLGDWLFDEPDGVEIFSEQQLRRLNTEMYPPWVPKSPLHRTDGYTLIPLGNTNRVLAFEIELSRKSIADYEIVADRYADIEGLTRVLWLVPTPSRARTIHEHLVKGSRGKPFIHDFVSYGNFMQHGWQAKIELGPEAGKPVALLMGLGLENGRKTFDGHLLLNTRKCPFESVSSAMYELDDFRDRLGIYHSLAPNTK